MQVNTEAIGIAGLGQELPRLFGVVFQPLASITQLIFGDVPPPLAYGDRPVITGSCSVVYGRNPSIPIIGQGDSSSHPNIIEGRLRDVEVQVSHTDGYPVLCPDELRIRCLHAVPILSGYAKGDIEVPRSESSQGGGSVRYLRGAHFLDEGELSPLFILAPIVRVPHKYRAHRGLIALHHPRPYTN